MSILPTDPFEGEAPTPSPKAAPAPSAASVWLPRTIAALASILLFIIALVFYTRQNTFPYEWHPDERGKATQIVNNIRNHRHPHLLLEATDWIVDAFHVSRDSARDYQHVVETGRLSAAGFAAVAVVVIALTGYQFGGLLGFLLAGLAGLFCPSLLANAHYMKEDTALVMGICLTLLATKVFWDARRPIPRILSLLFIGASCGLAVSGKYAGFYVAIAAVPILFIAPPFRHFAFLLRPIPVVAAFLFVVVHINHYAFNDDSLLLKYSFVGKARPVRHNDPTCAGGIECAIMSAKPDPASDKPGLWEKFGLRQDFARALDYEKRHAQLDHYGLTMRRPNMFFLDAIKRESSAPILLIAVLFLIMAAAFPRKASVWDIYAVLLIGGYLAMICWSVIPQSRYVLPVIVAAHLFMALAVVRVIELLPSAANIARITIAAGFAAFLLGTQLPQCLDYLDQFNPANDSRTRVARWVETNIKGERIAADDWCRLRNAIRLPKPTDENPALPDVAALRNRSGVKYIAVIDRAYERYFDPSVIPIPQLKEDYDRRKQFYQSLLQEREAQLVWDSVAGTDHRPIGGFTNPVIRVYRLGPSVSITPSTPASRPAPLTPPRPASRPIVEPPATRPVNPNIFDN